MTALRSALSVAILLILACPGCAPWNAVTRTVPSDNNQSTKPGDSAYLESHRTDGRNYGCSFIEFDGKGGFLSFPQFTHAKHRLSYLKAHSNVLLVIYCHGWNNNPQSADVLRFMSFLRHLSDTNQLKTADLRVEGVYLGWRGSQYEPVLAKSDATADPKLSEDFGLEPLTDARWQLPASIGLLVSPAKYFSYWSIKDRAEFHVSRVPLARAVFELAFTLKTPQEVEQGRNHRVFVLGHSFGALLLEQAIGQASVGLLSSEWTRGEREARWPIDLIVFLNSAAPSLYAKQLEEFLQDDRPATQRPRIVSLTSTGDWATGTLHPIGNFGNRFAVDLQRRYYPKGHNNPSVKAGDYYALTPGHNPLLYNHVVEPYELTAPQDIDDDQIFAQNLRPVNSSQLIDVFLARSPLDNQVHAWRLRDLTVDNPKERVHPSNYWIGTVPRDIIRDHNDIWSTASMEMLAGIYRIANQLGTKPSPKVSRPVLNQD